MGRAFASLWTGDRAHYRPLWSWSNGVCEFGHVNGLWRTVCGGDQRVGWPAVSLARLRTHGPWRFGSDHHDGRFSRRLSIMARSIWRTSRKVAWYGRHRWFVRTCSGRDLVHVGRGLCIRCFSALNGVGLSVVLVVHRRDWWASKADIIHGFSSCVFFRPDSFPRRRVVGHHHRCHGCSGSRRPAVPR